MATRDNYRLQAEQAQQFFLRYDQQQLIRKLNLRHDGDYLYAELLCQPYRIHRETGGLQRFHRGQWIPAESHGEVMTLLDLVCDSRPDRFVSGRWKQMTAFGLMFHQEMLEDGTDPLLRLYSADPAALHRACIALGGKPMPGGDLSYTFTVFDGLPLWLQIWEGDEEFPSRLRWLWDENATMYLKYETMYFAVGLLRQRMNEIIREETK